MNISDIQKIISTGETRTLELKKSTGELKSGMHSACAFLNTDGGWLIIGVTPKSLNIVGQIVTDSTQQEIANALKFIEPAVDVKVEYVEIPERPGYKVIAMHFDAWLHGMEPYTYNGRPYYKVESTTLVMPRSMFNYRIKSMNPNVYSWELRPASETTIEDLNESRIRSVVRTGIHSGRMSAVAEDESLEMLLKKLGLLYNGVPNNAAAMLFTKAPYRYTNLRLRLARFIGTNKNEFFDNQRVDGNFFDLLDAGMAFFFKHLSLSGKIVGLKREEYLEVPFEALREVLINALCHRDYDKHNLTIGIAIYDDRIEIESPGELVRPMTVENIREPHISYPRNQTIANVLHQTTYLESWGSGIDRIYNACAGQGVTPPTWKEHMGFVVVTFIRPFYDPINKTYGPNKGNSVPTDEKLGANRRGPKTEEIDIIILNTLKVNPKITRTQLSLQTGRVRSVIDASIRRLKEEKCIERIGGSYGGYWRILKKSLP